MPASDLDRSRVARELAAAVREAGALALAARAGPLKHWTKGKDSPVTEADIAVDRLLKERLAGPDFGWLSEESEDDPARLTVRRVWVVDPIDGTRAYIAGRSDWVISAALVEGGRPVIGAIFAPAENEFFLGIADAGATCNDRPLATTVNESLSGARVTGPRHVMERLTQAEPGLIAEPRVHSLALRFARVAQGSLDIALAGANSHDWDLAAADLLVHEAGGMLTSLAGEPVVYNRAQPIHGPLVAAGLSRHRALTTLLRERLTEFS